MPRCKCTQKPAEDKQIGSLTLEVLRGPPQGRTEGEKVVRKREHRPEPSAETMRKVMAIMAKQDGDLRVDVWDPRKHSASQVASCLLRTPSEMT